MDRRSHCRIAVVPRLSHSSRVPPHVYPPGCVERGHRPGEIAVIAAKVTANVCCPLLTTSHTSHDFRHRLLVLVSQRPRPISFSLTSAPSAPTPGEAAVQHLLRVIRAPLTQLERSMQRGNSTFLSSAQPRDRRGWIAQKYDRRRSGVRCATDASGEGDEGDGDFGGGGETPRMAARFAHMTHLRERDEEFLESLRYDQ